MITNILTNNSGLGSIKLPVVPPQRKSKPRSADQAALAKAVKVLIAEDDRRTPTTVADHSGGLSLNQVYAVMRGEANPTFLNLIKLADGLHVSLGELMTLIDELREKPARKP
jgi:transcriptional regulator with XRE-family HTH domain